MQTRDLILQQKQENIQQLKRKREDLSYERDLCQSTYMAAKLDYEDAKSHLHNTKMLIKESKESLIHYIKSTRKECPACQGKDIRMCICHNLCKKLVMILLVYERRKRKGEITHLPHIPKVVLINVVYMHMKRIILTDVRENMQMHAELHERHHSSSDVDMSEEIAREQVKSLMLLQFFPTEKEFDICAHKMIKRQGKRDK